MRGAVLVLLGVALASLPSIAQAGGSAHLRTQPSTSELTVAPGQEVALVVHVTGAMDCTLPGAPEDATVRLNKSDEVRRERDQNTSFWGASPAERTFRWRQSSLTHYAIDESFTLSLRASGVFRHETTEALAWQTVKQVSSGTNCERSFDWVLQSDAFTLRIVPNAASDAAAGDPAPEAAPAQPLEYQGVSSTPTEGKVMAGAGVALAMGALGLILVIGRRAR